MANFGNSGISSGHVNYVQTSQIQERQRSIPDQIHQLEKENVQLRSELNVLRDDFWAVVSFLNQQIGSIDLPSAPKAPTMNYEYDLANQQQQVNQQFIGQHTTWTDSSIK